MEPRAATLCKRCQLLEFDDAKAGGEVGVTENGMEFLVLPMRRYTMLEDEFPHLLHLERSAWGGCEFCALLRDTILKRAND
ncbi:hypothetical protein B0T16DRAFT_455836 [Cercophora newfieldiana]|uniref:Uncharacterized protein n=1 Tax=Cercophora newfieldiana TaxID=92897 RepID=A0AA39Y9S6_9PEZI|nr:hypothetical protein B0T16DRAFT_455836 [Cercophora newfieldiana]